MPLQKNKQKDETAAATRSDGSSRTPPPVVVRASAMTQQQEHRLSTAVDALLAEWVRQQMGRAQPHHD